MILKYWFVEQLTSKNQAKKKLLKTRPENKLIENVTDITEQRKEIVIVIRMSTTSAPPIYFFELFNSDSFIDDKSPYNYKYKTIALKMALKIL